MRQQLATFVCSSQRFTFRVRCVMLCIPVDRVDMVCWMVAPRVL